MHLTIQHTTTYRFEVAPAYGLQQLRLTPQNGAGQTVIDWAVTIDGGEIQTEFTDHHQNHVSLISFDPDVPALTLHCQGSVETKDLSGIVGKHSGFAPLWVFMQPTELTRVGPKLRRLMKTVRDDDEDQHIARLHSLSEHILEHVPYTRGATDALTTAEDAVEHGGGVCQDHAHVFIAAARAMGYPARYVSGYLLLKDQAQQHATHAWAEVHIDPLGWVGFDVSNGMSPDARYVRVATGADYRDAAPISGVRLGDGGEVMSVDIHMHQQ